MLLIVDANVLIDYASTELAVLALVARHVGFVHVATVVLDEVEGLTEERCQELGFRVVEPSLEQLLEAGSRRGTLSFEDRVCLTLARENRWVCVSNDKALRRECEAVGVPQLWGLQLMVRLVEVGQLPPDAAVHVAEAIRAKNPAHITSTIIERFRELVGLATGN